MYKWELDQDMMNEVSGDAAGSPAGSGEVGDGKVTTIEGLPPENDPVQQAWRELDVPQCGYCQPGMIMASLALLRETPSPTEADIDAAITNICRCGTYTRVRRAILAAARRQTSSDV